MSNRFELEEQLVECWQVVDDIKLLQESYAMMDDDARMNLLQGLVELYNLKFERAWNTFHGMDWSLYE